MVSMVNNQDFATNNIEVLYDPQRVSTNETVRITKSTEFLAMAPLKKYIAAECTAHRPPITIRRDHTSSPLDQLTPGRLKLPVRSARHHYASRSPLFYFNKTQMINGRRLFGLRVERRV